MKVERSPTTEEEVQLRPTTIRQSFGGAIEIQIGPIMLRAIALATAVMLLGTGIPMWATTGSVWDGLGFGAFCAFWGGPGFGCMAGGAIWAARLTATGDH